ncbi:hypothetical protein PUN28_014345 [Cardiocondyla obscurior]|uniref:Uncharacterized protein n=1 Tax=Cardiocondyla obscurior TaxID=286306 RepID=A0AAW2F319_9HYME
MRFPVHQDAASRSVLCTYTVLHANAVVTRVHARTYVRLYAKSETCLFRTLQEASASSTASSLGTTTGSGTACLVSFRLSLYLSLSYHSDISKPAAKQKRDKPSRFARTPA